MANYFWPLILLIIKLYYMQIECASVKKCKKLNERQIIEMLFTRYVKTLPMSQKLAEFSVNKINLTESKFELNSEESLERGEQNQIGVLVGVELHVQDVSSLNEITSDFEIDILFSQLWFDPSLSFSHMNACKSNITMEHQYLANIWTPNTCIFNSKETKVHSSPTPNIMFILYENGTIWLNYRLSVRAPCTLDLRKFPFDVQQCQLIFESYSYNHGEVRLKWFDQEPITLMKKIELPDFDLVGVKTENFTLPYPNGLWDRLKVTFKFKRRFGFYILQAYVPHYITIIVSWVSFCMEPSALPSRTTVGVSALLALTFQFGNIMRNLPRVSYIKAIDVWMLGCISFVFATTIELGIICCLGKRDRKRASSHDDAISNSTSVPMHCTRNFHDDHHPAAEKIHNSNGIGHTQNIGTNFLITERTNPTNKRRRRILRYDCMSMDRSTRSPLMSPWPSMRVLEPGEPSTAAPPCRRPSSASKLRCNFWQKKFPFTAERVDEISMVLFPLAFSLFNLVYWFYYLRESSGPDEQDFNMPDVDG